MMVVSLIKKNAGVLIIFLIFLVGCESPIYEVKNNPLIEIEELYFKNSTFEEENVIRIAILDSGINEEYAGLESFIAKKHNIINNENVTVDDFGHGTTIANIIINEDSTYESNARHKTEIYDVKVLNEEGRGEPENIAKGIEWSIKENVDIINMSFGMDTSHDVIKKAVNKASANNILLVAAAGNTFGLGTQYPAAYENVLSINALDEKDNRLLTSAKGKIDFAVRGANLPAIDREGQIVKNTGTSFATAHATRIFVDMMDCKGGEGSLEGLLQEQADIVKLGEEKEFGRGKLTLKQNRKCDSK